MQGATFTLTLELVIALPDHPAIFVRAVPDLRAEVVAAIAADQAAGKNGLAAIAPAQRLSPGHLFLYPVKQERVDDGLVAVLHIILWNLPLVDLHFLLQEIHGESLLEEGVAPERIYIGHVMDSAELDYAIRLLDMGVYIGFDRFASAPISSPKIQSAILNLTLLCSEGYSKQILLGNDGCAYQTVVRTGDLQKDPSLLGNDYTILPGKILPLLREAGVSDECINAMTVGNPERLFEQTL